MAKPKPQEPDLLNDGAQTPEPPSTPAKRTPKQKGAEVVKFEPPQPKGILEIIADAAKNPEVDATKARELFQLYLDTEARQQFHDALMAIEFPSIDRDGKIPVSGGKALRFASFENVHKAVVPLLRKAGFRMSFQPMPAPSGEGMVVECKLIRGIYEEKCVVPISTAPASRAMNAQQAIGAAIKYASRYGMMYLLNLYSEAPEDRDTDGNLPGDPISAEQLGQLVKACEVVNAPQDKLVAYLNGKRPSGHPTLEKLESLPASRFREALDTIQTYRPKQ